MWDSMRLRDDDGVQRKLVDALERCHPVPLAKQNILKTFLAVQSDHRFRRLRV